MSKDAEDVLFSSEGLALQAMISREADRGKYSSPLRAITERCHVLERYATTAAASKVERATVRAIIEAGFDKFIAPQIDQYDPPGPNGLYVAAARWLVTSLALRGYDLIRKA